MVIELKYHGKDKANIFIYNQFYTFIAYFIRMISLYMGEWSGNMCLACTEKFIRQLIPVNFKGIFKHFGEKDCYRKFISIMRISISGILLVTFLIIVLAAAYSFNVSVGKDQKIMDETIDAWHAAAARGDSVAFFGSMTEKAIYLGTDEAERWDRASMARDLGRHFNGKKAWKFQSYNRQYTDLKDRNSILFDECLKTWMGPCKATGMLSREKGRWKISYYNLSVAVPNDYVKQYTKLLPSGAILTD